MRHARVANDAAAVAAAAGPGAAPPPLDAATLALVRRLVALAACALSCVVGALAFAVHQFYSAASVTALVIFAYPFASDTRRGKRR